METYATHNPTKAILQQYCCNIVTILLHVVIILLQVLCLGKLQNVALSTLTEICYKNDVLISNIKRITKYIKHNVYLDVPLKRKLNKENFSNLLLIFTIIILP